MTPEGPHLVFVYGTLKRGEANHHHLAGQHFVAAARTQPGFTLYQPADYPGMVCDHTDRDGVTGEIWAVDPACLARLDEFEGVPEGLYRRVTVPLAAPHTGLAVDAYLYLPPVAGCPHLGPTWHPTADA